MQSRKELKPIMKSLSRSGSSKEATDPAPADQAGATASVTLNTAYAKVNTPKGQQEEDVATGGFYRNRVREDECLTKHGVKNVWGGGGVVFGSNVVQRHPQASIGCCLGELCGSGAPGGGGGGGYHAIKQ